MDDARPKVRLIGLPTDSHSSFLRGSAAAPAAIRAAIWSDQGNSAVENGLEFGNDILVEDSGDLPLDEGADDVGRIRAAAEQAMRDGVIPLFLGGDHMVTNPIVAGIRAVHGPINILHFDAHPDIYEDFGADPLSHASPFARIMERGDAKRLVQLGIRTATRHSREQARRYDVEVMEMRDFDAATAPIPEAPLYISIDLDGLDPAFAPGVSHHEPGGLTVRDVMSVLQRVPGPIVGADVVELNPSRDINGVTAVVAAKLIKELAALSASRRGSE